MFDNTVATFHATSSHTNPYPAPTDSCSSARTNLTLMRRWNQEKQTKHATFHQFICIYYRCAGIGQTGREKCGRERNRMLNYSYFLPKSSRSQKKKCEDDQKLQISLANEKSNEKHINKVQCLCEVVGAVGRGGAEKVALICSNLFDLYEFARPGRVAFGSIRLRLRLLPRPRPRFPFRLRLFAFNEKTLFIQFSAHVILTNY